VWAFSDESERAGVMLLAVVTIAPVDVGAARMALRSLLLSGQRRVHTSDESPRRRRALLETVSAVDGLAGVVWRYRRPPGTDRVAARRLLLAEAARALVAAEVTSWVLDDVHPAQRVRDRDAIVRVVGHSLVYDHRRSHTEPLLWAADAVAWAVGAGGHWRAQLSAVIEIRDIAP
jgi:hypothetical protein